MMMKDFASPQLVATDDQTHMIFSLSDAGINGWTTSSCVHEEEAVDGIIGLDPSVLRNYNTGTSLSTNAGSSVKAPSTPWQLLAAR